jgi:hypothetical protein
MIIIFSFFFFVIIDDDVVYATYGITVLPCLTYRGALLFA